MKSRTAGGATEIVSASLGGLDTCVEEGIRLPRDWLDAGACLDTATPFLQMVLQDRKDSH